MEIITLKIPGRPVSQGSKRTWAAKGKNGYTGKVSSKEMNAGLQPFRQSVQKAFIAKKGYQTQGPYEGPVSVQIQARYERPGKGAKCQHCPCGRGTPDIDKNARAVLDALTLAGVIKDDSQVINLNSSAFYVDGDESTVIIVRGA